MKKFITRIQNSDESTKKFWLFVFSGISMVIVIGLWATYMSLTVARISQPANSGQFAAIEKQETRNEKRDEPGPFAIFAAGVKIIFDQAKSAIISATNNIVIQNPERNFQAENVEAIPATNLP